MTTTEQIYKTGIEKIIRFYESIGLKRSDNPNRPPDYPSDPAAVLLRSHDRMVNPENPWTDCEILQEFFSNEVWSDAHDDIGVSPENQRYNEVLAAWAKISHGIFNPQNVRHVWDQDGVLSVTFDLNGAPAIVTPYLYDEGIDIDILDPINDLLGSSGRKFQCVVGETAIIMCISEDQKQKMIAHRNFPFADRLAEQVEAAAPEMFLD